MQIHVCYVCVNIWNIISHLNKLGHFVGFHQIGDHGNFIFTKKVARQPYFLFLFSNSPLNSTTDVKKLESSMKGLLLWKSVEIALK